MKMTGIACQAADITAQFNNGQDLSDLSAI